MSKNWTYDTQVISTYRAQMWSLWFIDLLHFKLTEPKVIKILSQPDNLGCPATFSGQCNAWFIPYVEGVYMSTCSLKSTGKPEVGWPAFARRYRDDAIQETEKSDKCPSPPTPIKYPKKIKNDIKRLSWQPRKNLKSSEKFHPWDPIQ